MSWRRLGLVYLPDGRNPKLATHAALPTPFSLGGDLVRVYFSGRDEEKRSSIGSFVLRLGDSPRLEEAPGEPSLIPGAVGAFDDSGCSVGSVVASPEGDRLYYMGWNLSVRVPFRNAFGMAVGDAASGRFERYSAGPLMDRDPVDHHTLSYPWVLRFGPDDWRMWYGTAVAWSPRLADIRLVLRAASSTDGIHWRRDSRALLEPEGDEIALARPCVLAGPSGGEMWFASRTEGPFSLWRAQSRDLAHWSRDKAALMTADATSWEGDAMTYPTVIETAGRRWMFYNGTGYGASGVGLAVWEQ